MLIRKIIIGCLLAAGLKACIGSAASHPEKEDSNQRDSVARVNKAWQQIDSVKNLLQDGDLVTRSDNDFESRVLQNFSPNDKTFSHSGLAFKEEEGGVVYHAMTGIENPTGSCRRDPLDSFANPAQKSGLGLFRYKLQQEEVKNLHQYMKEKHKQRVPFDITFNLHSDDSLYCSEMIWKGLQNCTKRRVVLPTQLLYNFRPKIMGYKYNQVLLKKFEYISIDNLYINPFCTEIKRVDYFHD